MRLSRLIIRSEPGGGEALSHVVYDTLNRRQFHRLPKTDPPLEFREGMVVHEGNGGVIYRGITLEQFLRLPEAKPALEYIDGIVVQKVSPKTTHSVPRSSSSEIRFRVRRPARICACPTRSSLAG